MGRLDMQKMLLIQSVDRNVSAALIDVGEGLVEKIRSSMVSGSGRKYKYKGKIHFASSPGMPPAPLYGRLRDSITYHTSWGKRSGIGSSAKQGDAIGKPYASSNIRIVSVGSNVPYALAMEKGLKRGRGSIANRPYLWPALKGSRELIKTAFSRV